MSENIFCARCPKFMEENTTGCEETCNLCHDHLRARSILRPEHLAAGLSIEEDDHVLKLKQQGRVIALFTIEANKTYILEEADNYL